MPAKSPASLSSPLPDFSIFSGTGFVDLGFKWAGCKSAIAQKLNAKSEEGYRHSNAKMGLLPASYGNNRDSIANHLLPTETSVMQNQIAEPRAYPQGI